MIFKICTSLLSVVIEVKAVPPVGDLEEEQIDLILHRAVRQGNIENSIFIRLGLKVVLSSNVFLLTVPQIPKCFWYGTAPFCAGECPEGWKAIAYDSTGDGAACWTGMKVFCCPDASHLFSDTGILENLNSFVTR